MGQLNKIVHFLLSLIQPTRRPCCAVVLYVSNWRNIIAQKKISKMYWKENRTTNKLLEKSRILTRYNINVVCRRQSKQYKRVCNYVLPDLLIIHQICYKKVCHVLTKSKQVNQWTSESMNELMINWLNEWIN